MLLNNSAPSSHIHLSLLQEMLMKSRARDTGTKLQVNEKILDSVTKLMEEIQMLVRKSKSLQEEIVSSGRVC